MIELTAKRSSAFALESGTEGFTTTFRGDLSAGTALYLRLTSATKADPGFSLDEFDPCELPFGLVSFEEPEFVLIIEFDVDRETLGRFNLEFNSILLL